MEELCALWTDIRRARKYYIRAGVLFVLSFLSCTMVGFLWVAEFHMGASGTNLVHRFFDNPWTILRGVPYATAIMSILLAHELGHFFACRRHGILCSPPYFLPMPIPWLPSFGTAGAVIRIRSPFWDRRQLFDVGAAGPLAGMAVAVPIFVLGCLLSVPGLPMPAHGEFLAFGDSLLTKAAAHLFFPGQANTVLHPLGWAALFGFLATSLNLLPIGQLDGGHIAYAVFGPRAHKWISHGAFVGLLLVSILSYPYPSYAFFAVLVFALTRLKHPPLYADHGPLGRTRLILAVLTLVVLVLTFIPVPFSVVEY